MHSDNVLEPTYRSLLGAIEEKRAAEMSDKAEKQRALERALLFYKQALNLQPGNVFYLLSIARVNTTAEAIDAGRFGEADRWWRRAVDHDPTNWADDDR